MDNNNNDKKIILNSLSLEMTRICQLNCAHCLRGSLQYKYNKPNIPALSEFLANIEEIDNITFTGGEPTIRPLSDYETIINTFKDHGVTIGNFYLATNCLCLTKKQSKLDFYNLVTYLYNNCIDNEISGIHFSRTKYHKEQILEDLNKTIDKEIINFNKLFRNDFSYVDKDNNLYLPINQGNAKTRKIGRKKAYSSIEINDQDDYCFIEGDVYLNCKGNIIASCDLSYKSQDNKKNIISVAKDFSIQACENFIKQNNHMD